MPGVSARRLRVEISAFREEFGLYLEDLDGAAMVIERSFRRILGPKVRSQWTPKAA